MAKVASEAKARGAYYTDAAIAEFLTDWAIRSGGDTVLEPSFGDGVFLRAALARLSRLAGRPAITGVDLHDHAWSRARQTFPGLDLRYGSFFDFGRDDLGAFDVVIGNPPFIRYQQFTGDVRQRALDRCFQHGVSLPALASAWAPFLVHAVSFLRPGGRLAVVAPFEITYARYARPLVSFLGHSFGAVHCLQFDEPLFPHLNESTVLLLCEDYGQTTADVLVHRMRSADDLRLPLAVPARPLPISSWSAGFARSRALDLPAECQELYGSLAESGAIVRLGEVLKLTIGYVTGDNVFFHPDPRAIERWSLEDDDLKLAVRDGCDLARAGLAITSLDADRLIASGGHRLFAPRDPLRPSAAAYVASGERAGVSDRYKCRQRAPWYRVPMASQREVLISVLATRAPRLVVNAAGALATNSVLVADRESKTSVPLTSLAVGALTTFAQLSAEIEGHALGGGALKFEPAEARRWGLPLSTKIDPRLVERIDLEVRAGRFATAANLADRALLIEGLGLTERDLTVLANGLERLRTLRVRSRRAVGQSPQLLALEAQPEPLPDARRDQAVAV